MILRRLFKTATCQTGHGSQASSPGLRGAWPSTLMSSSIFGPAYPRTAAHDLESCTLLRGCLRESPRPCQRNTNRPPVHQLWTNRVLSDRNSLNTSLGVSRNAHAKPPKSFHVECYLGTDLIQFSRRKTIAAAQRQGREPVLADLVLTLNVYVLAFVAIKL